MDAQEIAVAFTASGGEELKGVLHRPAGPGPFPALACFHGLTLNMGQFTILGRRLADQGIALLRFDASGHGISQGNLEAIDLASLVRDGQKAVAYLESRPEIDPQRLGLVGFSLGACVASLVARELG